MPPKVKITKQMIENASFELVRTEGHENLNVRNIAKYLGCSTQPVLYGFKTVDEIREATYEMADKYHTEYIMPKEDDEDPMLALGLNYVRFGQEEKNLFRFLFQTDKFGGKDIDTLFADPGLAEILGVMASGLKTNIEQAREMFLTFFCVAHGLASLLANNSMAYDEEKCRKMLEDVFYGMAAARKG
ncbi:MAG: TetR/AcrR family transcriptional regulator [Erysipelotrichaceae bacterium]|nr:TetR/AcrR family transcriptional regulator [Erysipelotrichaceae bacterium]